MKFFRESGILLHPTSLPGPYGIGEIGPQARAFIRLLKGMEQHLWQVLPLGPTGYGDSPYQSLSTFAGNPMLISFDQLVKDKLLSPQRLKRFPRLPAERVDYGRAINARTPVLQTVCRTFRQRATQRRLKAWRAFCEREAAWLDDYALFIALKQANGGKPWTTWPPELANRDPKALKRARTRHATAIRHVSILQHLFHEQWVLLREYARECDVRIIGDIPIFVAHDSADVWANPELFFLDGRGHSIVVAGVPPDYFSATGQLWGNPLYRWNVHRNTGYAWWVARMRKKFAMVDYLRIDHFRGFEKYWEVPAYEQTAMNGRWVDGPGADLFHELIKQLGPLPIIAEDLGIITPEVEALRDQFGFPGMRVLQFAFGTDPKAEDYRPENYPPSCVVYTGTHDNDTTVGWFWSDEGRDSTRTQAEIDAERQRVMAYLGTDGSEIHWDMIQLAMKSKANTAIFPIQDLLGLGSEARLNVPGRESGNWQWRLPEGLPVKATQKRLVEITRATGRNTAK